MRHVIALLLLALATMRGDAQVPDTVVGSQGTTVSGVVTDSLAGAPLAGAMVQLVGAQDLAHVARTATSDSLGRFQFVGITSGLYLLGFLHPLLDSLGLEPAVRQIRVTGIAPVLADLAVPSARALRSLACGSRAGEEPPAAVIGIVRYAEDAAPAANATVSGKWLEFSLNRQGGTRSNAGVISTTTATGRFALCRVPSPGVIGVVAASDADSTDMIEVEVPAAGFLRRDLYLGRENILPDSGDPERVAVPGELSSPPSPGRAILTGRVITSPDGRPLGGARVRIENGPQTRANEDGYWTLDGVRLGTRILLVRAVGFYPDRLVVDIVPHAPPVQIALPTMKAVLDTVRVLADRAANPMLREFYERRRSGIGRYLTPEDIARHQPFYISDVLRMQPGLRVERTSVGATAITMRGIFTGRCTPSFYINGLYMRTLDAEELDTWVGTDEAAGIEIYAPGTTPPQFQPALGGCGSIVVWTRPSIRSASSPRARRQLLTLGGLAAVGIAIGTLAR